MGYYDKGSTVIRTGWMSSFWYWAHAEFKEVEDETAGMKGRMGGLFGLDQEGKMLSLFLN